MPKFRKKPIVIDAVQWKGDFHPIAAFIEQHQIDASLVQAMDKLKVETLEGTMRADPDDWIILGIGGEIYPCKPDIFNACYELIAEDKPDGN